MSAKSKQPNHQTEELKHLIELQEEQYRMTILPAVLNELAEHRKFVSEVIDKLLKVPQ